MRKEVLILQEERFVVLHRELHAKAREAAEARKTLVELYVAVHFPGVPYKATIMDDNILSIDLVFPGLGRDLSQTIVNEVREYLRSLLEVNEQSKEQE